MSNRLRIVGRRRSSGEAGEQEAVMAWWLCAHRGLGVPDARLLYHVPNGGKRSIVTAAKMKRAGVRAGVPDLFLAMARGGFHGLYIELKRRDGGELSRDQVEVMAMLGAQGYCTEVAAGWEVAAALIEAYLALPVCRSISPSP